MADILLLAAGLAPGSFALAYYLATARVFRAPRKRADAWLAARSRALASGVDPANMSVADRARAWAAISLEFWRSMLECRKCWSQWASWGQLLILAGMPWAWSREEFIGSLGAAGLAVFAYEIVAKK